MAVPSAEDGDTSALRASDDHSNLPRNYKCTDCHKIFTNAEKYQGHILGNPCSKKQNLGNTTEGCNTDHLSGAQSSNVFDGVTSQFTCESCDKVFNSEAGWKYHVENKVCIKKAESMKLDNDCPNCGKHLGSRTAMRYHLKHSVCAEEKKIRQPSLSKLSNKKQKHETTGSGWFQGSLKRMNDRWAFQSRCSNICLNKKFTARNNSDLVKLAEDMWDFSDSISLSDWIEVYLSNCKAGLHQTVDLWALRCIDLGRHHESAVTDANDFFSLDSQIANQDNGLTIDPFTATGTVGCGNDTLPHDDFLINAGGAVWSLEFTPRSGKKSDQARYFAVGVGRIGFPNAHFSVSPHVRKVMIEGGLGPGYDIPHDISDPQIHDNIIQIWSHIALQSEGKTASITPPKLRYCVCLQKCGSILRTAWNMTFTEELCGSNIPSHDKMHGTLGLLGVVCEDGSCRILLLPAPSLIPTVNNLSHRSVANIPSVSVISEESVSRYRIVTESPIRCLSWSPHEVLKLCCGHTNGSISLWILPYDTERPSTNDGNIKRIYIVLYISTHIVHSY